MGRGIAVAGNMVADTIYEIGHYPDIGELAIIGEKITKTTGGAVCNVIIDLARLDESLPLTALGVIGDDEDGRFIESALSKYKNIDLSQIAHEGRTSFTAVMSANAAKQRTFFHYKGANALFSERHIDFSRFKADILHIGYPLLLGELDQPDGEFGTKLARLLSMIKAEKIKTSIDLVSDAENRYRAIVPHALKYTDYCIINESEAEKTTGIILRRGGEIIEDSMIEALSQLRRMGVSEWAVIHAPEGAYGINCVTNETVRKKSLKLPDGFIKGTTGAGDAFCAGVLYAAYSNKALPEAIDLGTACAVCSLSQPGSTEGMRSCGEALRLFERMKPTY